VVETLKFISLENAWNLVEAENEHVDRGAGENEQKRGTAGSGTASGALQRCSSEPTVLLGRKSQSHNRYRWDSFSSPYA
jgi:hypothetical protein